MVPLPRGLPPQDPQSPALPGRPGQMTACEASLWSEGREQPCCLINVG